MIPKKISKSNLKELVNQMLSEYKIYAPQHFKGDFDYLPLKNSDDIAFEFDRTRMSAKGIFLMPEQTMMTASRTKGDPKVVELSSEPQILFGARPCDITAINLLDDVFSQNYVDPYYKNERNRTIIIGMRCKDKCRTSFCGTMGSYDPKKGYDLMLTALKDDEVFLVETGSFKGEKIVRSHSNLFEDISNEDRTEVVDVMNYISKTFTPDVPMTGFRAIMELNWNEELWDKYNEICLSCGQCVFVCPTCWCFDVKEKVAVDPSDPGNIDKTGRIRRWTACLLKDFHTVAGGHVFKPTVASRLEMYYNHKLKGVSEKYGVWGCVGCGRCVSTCPVGIDIRESLNVLRGVEK
ncbi:MAG: 4Fe-4S dicluster domain-containing protein [Candidatus Hodarchaeales archaeon]